jgi:hypothetical protein
VAGEKWRGGAKKTGIASKSTEIYLIGTYVAYMAKCHLHFPII